MAARFLKAERRWIVDFWLEPPGAAPQRIRMVSPANTKKGAEEYERQLRDEMRQKIEAPASGAPTTHVPSVSPAPSAPKNKEIPSLRAFASDFLQNYAKVYNRPVEVTQKERVLKKHLLPLLGDLRLDEIDGRVISSYAGAKRETKLHPSTINQHLACLSKMLHVAEEWNVLPRGVAPRIRKLEVPPPEWDFLQPNESERLLKAGVDYDHEDYTLILTAVRTGLRISELLALRWDHIDLVVGTLRVRRSMSDGNEQGPKVKKERPIDLSPRLVEALKKHRHLRGSYVFCDRKGAPLTRDEANAMLYRARRKSGLRHVNWRMLRHTCASQLLLAGRSLKEVQEILGHADMTMTLRYAHLAPNAKREAAKALDDLGSAA
jgi:integrase